jgi:hypothetical protein
MRIQPKTGRFPMTWTPWSSGQHMRDLRRFSHGTELAIRVIMATTKTTKKLTKVTLLVTTAELGTRAATWYGPSARKVAAYFRKLWTDVGHVVVDG